MRLEAGGPRGSVALLDRREPQIPCLCLPSPIPLCFLLRGILDHKDWGPPRSEDAGNHRARPLRSPQQSLQNQE